MVMRMLRSWRDSLALLAPKTLKPLALVTLKSIIDTCKVLFKVWYLWVVPIAILIAKPYIYMHDLRYYMIGMLESQKISMPGHIIWTAIFTSLFVQLWYIVTISLAARPSVAQKKIDYFIGYLRYFLILLFVSCVIKLISFAIDMYLVSLYHKTGHFGMKQMASHIMEWYIWGNPLSSFFMFYLLFFLDSDGSVWQVAYSFVRSIKMFVFNLPLIIVLSISLNIVIIFGMVPLTIYQFSVIRWLLLAPITICIWVTLFTKRLHDQPDLYFNQPK